MRYHLVNINSDICEDTLNEGIGASTGCGLQDLAVGRTFDTLQQMLNYLSSYHGLSANEADYNVEPEHLQFDKQVANHSEAQNGGWFEPTEAEVSAWQRGEAKLYNESYDIHYLMVA